MSENFLEPQEDTAVPISSPEEQMPGLAGYVTSKFEDGDWTTCRFLTFFGFGGNCL